MRFMLCLIPFWIFASLPNYPGIQELSSAPRVYFIPNFLSEKECDYLIELAKPNLVKSAVVNEEGGGTKADYRRNSEGAWFPSSPSDKILQMIERRIVDLTGVPQSHGEALHVLHYGIGGEYQPHYDYFNMNTKGGIEQCIRGGQRIASCIMYLNTPAAGGETIFPQAKLSIVPKKGAALLFYNCLPTGEVDPLTLHGGAPVKGGEKWIMTKWIRTGEFR